MRAIIAFAHVLRPSSRSHGIFPAGWLLEYQEADSTRKGFGYAGRGDHGSWHNVRGD